MTDSAQWNHNNDWFVAGREGGTGTLTMSGNTQLNTVGGIGNIVFGDSGTADRQPFRSRIDVGDCR